MAVMFMRSIWNESTTLPEFPCLEGAVRTQVLVIGGGLTGILCAHFLKQAGIDCLLAEARELCGGTTGNTTAKITSQHGLCYHRIRKLRGLEAARQYYAANQQALEEYSRLARKLDFGFERRDSFVYALDGQGKLQRELEALQAIGAPAQLVQQTQLPFTVAGALRFPSQGQMNPLPLAAGLAKPLPIYTHTPVNAYDGKYFHTPRGRIYAEKTIVATHFPVWNKHGLYPLKMIQHRSYVLALENVPPVNGMYVDAAQGGLSFRDHGDVLLLGGGSHRTGKKGGGWAELESFAGVYYPKGVIRARWATQDCMSLDGIPYIGRYGAHAPNMYVATGYNKWGMTSAMVAARLLTDLVQGRENPYQALFDPGRGMYLPKLAANGLHALGNLVTPTTPRCPHLGCALKWNSQEHSWDCPCHGSRFGEDGQLLEGPATDDL